MPRSSMSPNWTRAIWSICGSAPCRWLVASNGSTSRWQGTMTSEAKPPFDAARFMRKIRTRQGEQDYLPLWPRVQWLRYDHPTAQVETVEVLANDKMARFKCVIHLPDGAIAVGHGQCEQKDSGDFFYEKAESTALGRALAILGYGTDAV